MVTIKALPIHPGIVEGSVFIKMDPIKLISQQIHHSINLEEEIERYFHVLDTLTQEFQQVQWNNKEMSNNTRQQLVQLYIALLSDPTFTKKVPALILEQKLPATKAVLAKLEIIKQEFSKINNEYFRSRFDDFQSIGHKIIEKLLGHSGYKEIKKPKIIVTESLSAAELLHIPVENILGILTATGGVTSHAAIIAEALDIPSIFGLEENINLISSKDNIIMDAYTGTIIVNPSPEISLEYQSIKEKRSQYKEDITYATQTHSDSSFSIMANIGNIHDLDMLTKYYGDGIGLLRTETMVLLENSYLSEEEQTSYYSALLEKTQNMPVVIRTLDLGGDKKLQDNQIMPIYEDNPFLGFRSTRLFVQDSTEFKKQIRALINAFPKNPKLQILLPFITILTDFITLKNIILDCYEELHGHRNCPIPIGIMAEIPSTLICIDHFLEYVDFVSIGTNDLIQYVLATDRNNTYVSQYHQSTHPSILRLLQNITKCCNEYNIPLSLCGEMGKEPHLTRLLLGFGIRSFSMSPPSIPMIKYIATYSDIEECKKLVTDIQGMRYSEEIFEYLKQDLVMFLKSKNAYFENNILQNSKNNKIAGSNDSSN